MTHFEMFSKLDLHDPDIDEDDGIGDACSWQDCKTVGDISLQWSHCGFFYCARECFPVEVAGSKDSNIYLGKQNKIPHHYYLLSHFYILEREKLT